MKTRTLQNRFIKRLLPALAILSSFSIHAQEDMPELIFRQPELEAGSALQDSSSYRFRNVTEGLDALVQIMGRSASNVVVRNIDMTSVGWDKAFQPEVGLLSTVAANQHWWVDFRVQFVTTGTSNTQTINEFVVTALDVDGDGNRIREYVEMRKAESVTLASASYLLQTLVGTLTEVLDLNDMGNDYLINGPAMNFTDIDTSATGVMATANYQTKNRVDFRIGGRSTLNGSNAGMRMNSLWFKEFDLNPFSTLPVKLLDFSAVYAKPDVRLSWTTAGEENFSHFVLEQSSDGSVFSDAALIFGAGEANAEKKYSYTDKTSASRQGLIFYRLRMVDLDGHEAYSPTRIIRLEEEKQNPGLTLFPNPATSNLRVTVPSTWQGKPVNLYIYSMSGQIQKQVTRSNSSQTESLDISSLAPGIYILKAGTATESFQQKFLRQ